MLIDERQSQIIQIVDERKYVKIEDLVKLVYASEATIRRDLNLLHAYGMIRRVRGGASTIDKSSGETSSYLRQQTNLAEKRRMANACTQFLGDGLSYFFDSSTTVSHIIPHLKKIKRGLAITNGLNSANLLNTIAGIRAFVIGGEVQTTTGACIGGTAVDMISKFECDVCFFSCHGFTLSGPTEGTIDQQKAKETMLLHSRLRVLVVDHTKFDKGFLIRTCKMQQIDVLVTDQMPPEPYLAVFKENNVRLIVA